MEFVVVIPADSDEPVQTKEFRREAGDRGTLDFFQRIVGGNIEIVPALLLNRSSQEWADVSICLNEEGKLIELPFNARASAWYAPLHDVIVGDVALIGPPDGEGNTTGFDADQAKRLARRVGRI